MLGGRENGAATLENSTQFLKNLNTELPHGPGIPALPNSTPKELNAGTLALRFIATIFTAAKGRSNPGIHEG